MWGPAMFPSQVQANARWPGHTGLKLTGEGEVLSVFWPLISEVALGTCPLVCPPCMFLKRKTQDALPLSVEWLTTVPAELFRFGATFTVAGKNKIYQVPWGASLQVWTHRNTAVWYVVCPQSNAVKLYPCYTDLAVVCGFAQLTGVCDSCWGFLYRSESCADSTTG